MQHRVDAPRRHSIGSSRAGQDRGIPSCHVSRRPRGDFSRRPGRARGQRAYPPCERRDRRCSRRGWRAARRPVAMLTLARSDPRPRRAQTFSPPPHTKRRSPLRQWRSGRRVLPSTDGPEQRNRFIDLFSASTKSRRWQRAIDLHALAAGRPRARAFVHALTAFVRSRRSDCRSAPGRSARSSSSLGSRAPRVLGPPSRRHPQPSPRVGLEGGEPHRACARLSLPLLSTLAPSPARVAKRASSSRSRRRHLRRHARLPCGAPISAPLIESAGPARAPSRPAGSRECIGRGYVQSAGRGKSIPEPAR